jgi:hypothetical protein
MKLRALGMSEKGRAQMEPRELSSSIRLAD